MSPLKDAFLRWQHRQNPIFPRKITIIDNLYNNLGEFVYNRRELFEYTPFSIFMDTCIGRYFLEGLAFPLLAAGNNGYDVDLAFQIAGRSIEEYQPENTLETVYIVLYGYDAMGVARKHGYSVEEFIDQKAVFLKEDEKKHPAVKLFEKGQDFANGVKDKGLEQAMAFLDNEENQDMVLEHGKKIAADAIRFGIDLAKDKIKNKQ